MSCARFVVLRFCRLLMENDGFKVNNASFGEKLPTDFGSSATLYA